MTMERKMNFSCLVACVLLTTIPAMAQAAATQTTFSTPEKAVNALVFATRNDHTTEMVRILGPGGDKLVYSGDDVADNESRDKFTAAYDKAHRLESTIKGNVVLVVGEEDWPMPIPLVHTKHGWRFDSKSGQQEILDRRIGKNELNVIEVCRAYVEAQRDFAIQHPLQNGASEYAQNFQSTEGQHDGLYWEAKDGEPESPLGPLMASATAEGYSTETTPGKYAPYHGYYYKILKSQGPHAAGGAVDYIVDGHMSKGFALVAFPATYGDSGVMSFLVNENGIVYEKNLGRDTADIARDMTAYDPDESWDIVQ